MEESILNSVKKLLGIVPEYEAFDTDLITHINSVFMILQQMGVGPEEGFTISDSSATWDDFTTDTKLVGVRTYVPLKVRLIFDPPTGSTKEAVENVVAEMEWRLYSEVEYHKNE